MKKNLLLMATAVLALTSVVSCSDDIVPGKPQVPATPATVQFTTVLSSKDNFVNDKLGINTVAAWQVGEKLKLTYSVDGVETATEATIAEVAADGKATLSANIPVTQVENALVTFSYPADYDKDQLKKGQNGSTSADNLKLFDYAEGVSYLTVKGDSVASTAEVKLTNPLSIIKFTVNNSGTDITGKVTSVSFGGYAVTAAGQSPLYVAVEAADKAYEGNIAGADGADNNIPFIKAISVEAVSHELVEVNLEVLTSTNAKELSEVTADDLYKWIGADGKVYAAGTPGVPPVAMIAYVGAAGSVDADNAQYKGLAIALDNVAAAEWFADKNVAHTDVLSSTAFASHAADLRGIHYTSVLADACYTVTASVVQVAVDTIEVRDSVLIEGDNVAPYWQKRDSIVYKDSVIYDSAKHVHPVAAAVRSYAAARPAGASEWFIPTVGQWIKVLGEVGEPVVAWTDWGTYAGSGSNLQSFAEKLQAAGDDTFAAGSWFWTSTAYSTHSAVAVGFYQGVGVDAQKVAVTEKLPVRPFFAF